MTIATAQGGGWLPSIAIEPPTLTAILIVIAVVVAHILITNRIRHGTINPRPLSTSEWQKQIVVVTGSSGGVGVELVVRLAAKGANVTALDLRPLPAEAHDRLKAHGLEARVLEVQCDVSSLEEVQKAAKASRDHWGHGATAIVNNAGIVTPPTAARRLYSLRSPSSSSSSASAAEDDDAAWASHAERTLRVNLLSHLWTLRVFLPELVEAREEEGGKRHTHVVTMSSLMAHIGVPGLSDYVASKWGLLGLHETVKREIATSFPSSSSSSSGTVGPRTQTTLILPAHISTPLFPHWSVPKALQPFFPTVSAEYAAERIVTAMGSGRSATLYMPRTTWAVGFMGVLPEWIREGAQWVSTRMRGPREVVVVKRRRRDADIFLLDAQASGADKAVESMAAKASKEK